MQQESQRQLHHLEKIVAVAALLAMLLLTVGVAQAQTRKVFLRSSAVLVQDASSGRTILAKNSDQVMPIASITKLMTAMVLLVIATDLPAPTLSAALVLTAYMPLVIASAALWSAAFLVYFIVYAPRLARPRLDGKPG